MSLILHGRNVVPGSVEGEALVSHEPISGWGGIDPARGVIIEPRHELFGVCFTGKILVFPSAKGSSGWSGFFQTTRLSGTAPIGMIIGRISAKSALGAVVTRVPGSRLLAVGTLLVGGERSSFAADLRRLPALIWRFLLLAPRWLGRRFGWMALPSS